MGFLDAIKNLFGGAANQAVNHVAQQAHQAHNAHAQAQNPQAHQQPQAPHGYGQAPQQAAPQRPAFDTAGFDLEGDEESFFNAVLHMESEGMHGGTDESRAEISARFGIRDRSHWQSVKDACYQVLSQRHGSFEDVMQREMNWRQGQMQQHMRGQAAQKAASGELAPVEGISLESWAATNAAIVQGANLDDLLKGAGVDRARWDRARVEWEARMARDTTFTVAQIYGAAFQNASTGKYGALAREANAARAANTDLTSQPPMSLEQYFEVLLEQAYASKQGKDAQQALKDMNLSVVDWCDLSTYMGYLFHRTAAHKHQEYDAAFKRVEAKMQAKYPGVQADVDIAF